MKFLIFVLLVAYSSLQVLGARRRSTRARIRDEIVEDALSAIEFYANNFHINDTVARNIFEGALHTAAQAKSPADRENALIEFYETQGAANVSRVSSINGFQMAAVPGLVEKYIYGNDLKEVLKKAFALAVDEEFRKGNSRQMEEKLTCIVVNCTERYLRSGLRNLASTFVEVVQPIILEHMDLLDPNNVHDSTFFDQAVEIATDKSRTLSQRAQDLGKLYEEKTSTEFKKNEARKMAKIFRRSFGLLAIGRAVKFGQEDERIYQKLGKLPFDQGFRGMREEERKQQVKEIIFPPEDEVKGQEKKNDSKSSV